MRRNEAKRAVPPVAAGGSPLDTNPALRARAVRRCGNRDPGSATVSQLWQQLLHLVSAGDWEIDPDTGSLFASAASWWPGSTKRDVPIVAFTNRLLKPDRGVFQDWKTFKDAADTYYTTWARSQSRAVQNLLGVSADPNRLLSNIDDYQSEFYKNTGALDIASWTLIGMRRLPPTVAKRELPGDYELIFAGNKGFPLAWRFSADDVVFYCNPETREAGMKAQSKFSLQPLPDAAGLPFCDPENVVPSAPRYTWQTVDELIVYIQSFLVPVKQWKGIGRSGWKATSPKQFGIPVVAIGTYAEPLGARGPEDRAQQRRLVSIQQVSASPSPLWKLSFVYVNPSVWRPDTSITVYGDEVLQVAMCPLEDIGAGTL